MVVVNRVYGLSNLSPTPEYFILMVIAFTYFYFFFFCRLSCGDNGIDIFGPYKGHTLIVQCKAFYTKNVGVEEIRAFEGALLK